MAGSRSAAEDQNANPSMWDKLFSKPKSYTASTEKRSTVEQVRDISKRTEKALEEYDKEDTKNTK